MNREIKFRVWDYQYNRWAREPDFKHSIGKEFGIKDYFINIAGEKAVRWNFLQYTGLKDKKGERIFEGDRVKHAGGTSIIRFADSEWQLDFGQDVDSLKMYEFFELEVIGNIQENPELLEQ